FRNPPIDTPQKPGEASGICFVLSAARLAKCTVEKNEQSNRHGANCDHSQKRFHLLRQSRKFAHFLCDASDLPTGWTGIATHRCRSLEPEVLWNASKTVTLTLMTNEMCSTPQTGA